ncbi:hypothetical protein [Agromyces albus]|uniref:Uncharacterized protein n=1 Tax=Agromyces albus TaxID=205332 RepID=A0A4Q2L3M0_9MICO|nr:hypothetical protein [Agromyces albus]RXZ72765.1 hypothetical protein ESP51_02910 [Agromyces albus]
MEEAYRNVLSDAERNEYDNLGAVVDRLEQKRRRRLYIWAGVMGAVMVIVLIGVGVSIGTSRDGGEPAVPWLVAANVVLFTYVFGNLIPGFAGLGELKRAQQRRTKLTQEAQRRHSNGWRRYQGGDQHRADTSLWDAKSKRQMQHEWYGSHSELDWRDREQAEALGLDVETYISNVLENDRD